MLCLKPIAQRLFPSAGVLTAVIAVSLAPTTVLFAQTETQQPGSKTKQPAELDYDSDPGTEDSLLGNQPPNAGVLQLTPDTTYDLSKKLLQDNRVGFQLWMPLAPDTKDEAVASNFGPIKVRSHSVNAGGGVILLIHSEYPDLYFNSQTLDPVKRPDEFLEFSARKALRSKQNARLLHRKKITLDDHPGLEQAIVFPAGESAAGERYEAGIIFQRLFVRRLALDMVFVQMPKEVFQRDKEGTRQAMISFLDSFRYID